MWCQRGHREDLPMESRTSQRSVCGSGHATKCKPRYEGNTDTGAHQGLGYVIGLGLEPDLWSETCRHGGVVELGAGRVTGQDRDPGFMAQLFEAHGQVGTGRRGDALPRAHQQVPVGIMPTRRACCEQEVCQDDGDCPTQGHSRPAFFRSRWFSQPPLLQAAPGRCVPGGQARPVAVKPPSAASRLS